MKPTLLATASQRSGIMVLTKALTITSSAATAAEASASSCVGSAMAASSTSVCRARVSVKVVSKGIDTRLPWRLCGSGGGRCGRALASPGRLRSIHAGRLQGQVRAA
jgi:hypothetical protein